jgi:hypothetical protein
VRAPWIFSAVWAIVNPWLNDNDRAKVEISSGVDGGPALSPYIAPDQVPDFLGGLHCPGAGAPGAEGAEAPPPAAAAGELQLGAGKEHEVMLPLTAEEQAGGSGGGGGGLSVAWCWSTDEYDLACAVSFRPDQEGAVVDLDDGSALWTTVEAEVRGSLPRSAALQPCVSACWVSEGARLYVRVAGRYGCGKIMGSIIIRSD